MTYRGDDSILGVKTIILLFNCLDSIGGFTYGVVIVLPLYSTFGVKTNVEGISIYSNGNNGIKGIDGSSS